MAEADTRVAMSFEDRDYTRAELDSLAGGLAATLRERGVRAGDRVALMASTRPEFVLALQAIWGLDAAAVLLSPAWKLAEVQHAMAVTQPGWAVGDNPVLAGLMPMVSLDEPITPGSVVPPPRAIESDALFVFSSGTTGMPKAVRHTHRAFAAAKSHWQAALGLTQHDRLQILTPPPHILGLLNIATALDAGVWIRLHRRFNIDAMLHTIARDRITIEMAVAPIALALADHTGLESYDLSSLRFIMWGATPFMPTVADTITRRSGARWLTAYGASELPLITCNPIEDARLDTVGRPVPGVEVRVVSSGTGEPLPACEEGLIEVRSESMMAGYLPQDATADAFRDGWYRTGDIGRLDGDGYLSITDRAKEMIKVRGFQVAPAEIEAVLRDHPAVGDCAAFGVPDDADGEAIIVAVSRSGDVEVRELISFVDGRLASYKRPRAVVFVDDIPRLESGKALRRLLKNGYQQRRLGHS